MDVATLLDATNVAAGVGDSPISTTLVAINDNLELFILLFVLFKCLEIGKRGFNKLYKGKGV